ncbi:unnamed protein product, partial [Allacma fusca]
MSLVQYP